MSSAMVIMFLELLQDLRSIVTKLWLEPLAAESQQAIVMFRMRVEMPKIRAFMTPPWHPLGHLALMNPGNKRDFVLAVNSREYLPAMERQ